MGNCHYLEGNVKCQKVIEDTKAYLRLLGIDDQRLRVKWVSASEGSEFVEEIKAFNKLLEDLREKPFPDQRNWHLTESPIQESCLDKEIPHLTEEQVEYCMECSSCTGTCPVSRENPHFSPKLIIKKASMELHTNIVQSRDIWSCLGCMQCNTRCPALIDIAEFNRSYRHKAREAGFFPTESHHGILQAISHLQTRTVSQKRTDWAEKTGTFKETGDVFYFVGCLPYFDITFDYLNLSPLDSAKSVLSLLNHIGIEPVISDNERCCGHDALCSGDEETFRELALWNLEVIKASGAKTVLFSCPEGYATFKYYYSRYFGKLPFEVIHLTDFLAQKLQTSGLKFHSSSGESITYQDPCRLGRWDGIYDQPRQLLKAVPETNLVEMERTRENSLCCGTSAWMECSRCSKAIQIERLTEARQTGASKLITTCPKCQIHLTCAQSNEDIDIQVKDIYTHLVEMLNDAETNKKGE